MNPDCQGDDRGVDTMMNLTYLAVLEPGEDGSYSVSMRYPNELFLENRHAKQAIEIAQEFFDWAKDAIDSAENV